jgi:SAM-dependent methyltransferase
LLQRQAPCCKGRAVPHDRLYCYDFHGLRFDEVPGLELSSSELPDEAFYAAIYGKVTPDQRFIEAKRETGRLIASMLAEHMKAGRLLSWGAGTGIVEGELIKAGWTVDAVEPGESEHWPPDARRLDNIDHAPVEQYDVVMTVSTLYSQSDADCEILLRKFADRVKPGGFVLIAEQDTRSVLGAMYGLLRQSSHTPERGAQFWGFLRGPGYYLTKMPLRRLRSRYFALNDDWSYKPIPRPLRLFGRQLFSRRSKMQFHFFQRTGL